MSSDLTPKDNDVQTLPPPSPIPRHSLLCLSLLSSLKLHWVLSCSPHAVIRGPSGQMRHQKAVRTSHLFPWLMWRPPPLLTHAALKKLKTGGRVVTVSDSHCNAIAQLERVLEDVWIEF